MLTGLIGLSAAYVALAVLLLVLLVLGGRLSWLVKAGLILLTSGFYVVAYLALQALWGWPADQAPPARFRFVAAEVREPDGSIGYRGEIFLWAAPLDDPAAPPRAYRMAYQAALHEELVKARERAAAGRPQMGERRGGMAGPGQPGGGAYTFRDVSRRSLPPKQ